jgi:ABC-type nitrate/sulfonate/bicarbonate transport system ATPase subunit
MKSLRSRSGLTSAPTGSGSLSITNVNRTFAVKGETRRVLDHIELTVEEGSVVAVVGPSGCGKTTLLEIVCGLQQPDPGGRIEIASRDVTGKRGLFAYMPQRDALLPWRTAIQNATLGLEARGVSHAAARGEAHELFQVFNLSEFEGYYPKQLSIGMRQRVALLRTFLFPSTFMLLDEPFAALDAITRANVHVWLLDVWQRLRRTVLLVTHDIEEAIFLGDRVVVLSTHPGSIVLDVEVPLARPRTLEGTTTEEFGAIKRQLLEALGQQVQAFSTSG